MQNPRRPPAERRLASAARDRPISFNRRLEEAREARARVLAAREGQEDADPPAPGPVAADSAGTRGSRRQEEAAAATRDESPAQRAGVVWPAIPWRIAGGLLAVAAAGAVVIWLLLPGGQATQTGGQTAMTTAGDVAGAPPEDPPEEPAQAPAAQPDAATATAAADAGDVAEAEAETAALPEITAADRARAAGREALADAERSAPDAAGDRDSAEGSGDEAAADTIAVTEVVSRSGDGAAPARSDMPSDEAGAASPRLPAPEGAGPPDPTDVEGAAADAGRDVAAAAGETDAEPDAAGAQPEPAAAEEPAPPPAEAVDEAAATASEDAAPPDEEATAPPAAAGRLYVRAAPGVTAEQLDEIVSRLSDAGYAIENTGRVDFRISQTNVRYFHAADAELSAGVAETISGLSRDFTDFRPLPDPGTIEVWLAG